MIRVNDRDDVEWRQSLTVADLLEIMHYTYAHIFVHVNGELIRADEYATYPIPDGADVRVIHLMAGG